MKSLSLFLTIALFAIDSINLEELYNSLRTSQANIQSAINRMIGDTVTITTVDGHSIFQKIEFPGYQIENKGIFPNLYVYLYNPEDFFPHNDKIFQRALEYLRFYRK